MLGQTHQAALPIHPKQPQCCSSKFPRQHTVCNPRWPTLSRFLSVIQRLHRAPLNNESDATQLHFVTFSTTLGHPSKNPRCAALSSHRYSYKMKSYLDGVSVCTQSSPRGQAGEEAVAGDGEVRGERKRKVLVSLHKIIHLSCSEEIVVMSVK